MRSGRTLALLIGVLSLCGVAAGCTDDSPGAPRPTPSSTAPSTPSTVQLRLAVYGDADTVAIYQRIADAYTAAHPDVRFDVTATGDASAAAEAALGAIATGTNAPDVFLLDVDHLPDVVQADAVQPVDELLDARNIPFGDGIQRTSLAAFSANNGLACMPSDVSPLVAYYNQRLVRPLRLTLPDGTIVGPIDKGWTWEAFVAAANQAVTRGSARGAKGTYIPPDLETLMAFIRSAGGPVVDDERNPTRLELSNGDTRAALKTIAALTRDERLTLAPVDVAQKPAVEWFKEGKLGVLLGTRALLPSLRQATSLRFDVAPVPRLGTSQTVSSMNGYCIAKSSKHIDEAADFIAYAVDGDGVKIAAASGRIVPSSLDALHSPEFLQPLQPPANSSAYGEGARRSAPPPYSVHWVEAAASADDALRRILYGRTIDVASDETPELDALLDLTDQNSLEIFTPPQPTESPSP